MSGPLRVVHVSDCYPPRVGGIETQVHDLAVRQARAGHEVHVLTATAARPGGGAATAREDGVWVHRIASRVTLGVPVHPLERPLLLRALRRLRPDVVHVHAGVVSPFAYAGARAARGLGVPLAITWHCMLDGIVPLYRVAAAVTGWRGATVAASAVSTVAGERVANVLAVDPEDVLVVPNGLDVAAWAPATGQPDGLASDGVASDGVASDGVASDGGCQDSAPDAVDAPALAPAGPLRVVATQRLAPRKRPVPLVRVLARVHERLGPDAAGRPRVHLTLIGAGPEEHAVRAEVARRHLGDVVDVAGRVPRDELAGRYRREHVFLAPARLEAFGIAALEARAAGLAVVAGRGTGVSEFVRDGVDGLLTPDRADGLDDAAADRALADALERLASEHGLLAGLLAHNRRVPPAADWADVLTAADALYARARGRRGR